MNIHPLTAHIIEKRAELAAYEAQKRPARDAIMRMSIYLGGLEKAAQLCGIPTE